MSGNRDCSPPRGGVAIVCISHRMEEVRRIGDRITVLKDGRTVAQKRPVAETQTKELIRLMTGRSIEYVFPPRSAVPDDAPALLDVRGFAPTQRVPRHHLPGAGRREKRVHPGSVPAAVRAGCEPVPGGTQAHGLLLESVSTRVSVASMSRFGRGGFSAGRTSGSPPQTRSPRSTSGPPTWDG